MRPKVQCVNEKKYLIDSLQLLVRFRFFIPTNGSLHLLLLLLPLLWGCHAAHRADRGHVTHLLDANAGIDVCHVHLRDSLLAHHAWVRRVVAGRGDILDLMRMLTHGCWRLPSHILLVDTPHICHWCALSWCVFIALVLLIKRYRGRFFFDASLLEPISPFPTCASMAVLKVLTEVIGAEEFLRLVALAELVDHVQVTCSIFPVGCWFVAELLSTVTASIIGHPNSLRLTGYGGRVWKLGGGEECGRII